MVLKDLSSTIMSSDGSPRTSQHDPVDILILGAGWSSGYLIKLLEQHRVFWAGTRRTEQDGRIVFEFGMDPVSITTPFEDLPYAKTVLITFPVVGEGQAKRLVECYQKAHPKKENEEQSRLFIQLGTIWIWWVSTG
jgi:hypothetical protein